MAGVSYQTNRWFTFFLRHYEALHCPGETQRQLTLEKAMSTGSSLFAVHTEIPTSSKISSSATFLSTEIIPLTEFTILGVLATGELTSLSSCWILFRSSFKKITPFINMLFKLKHTSLYPLLSHEKNLTNIRSNLEYCFSFGHFE